MKLARALHNSVDVIWIHFPWRLFMLSLVILSVTLLWSFESLPEWSLTNDVVSLQGRFLRADETVHGKDQTRESKMRNRVGQGEKKQQRATTTTLAHHRYVGEGRSHQQRTAAMKRAKGTSNHSGGDASVHRENTKLENFLQPSKLPPHYFYMIGTLVKPCVTVLMFGPPRLDRPAESCFDKVKLGMKRCTQLLFLCMLFYQVYVDSKRIIRGFQVAEDWWEGTCFAFASLAASGNLGTFFCNFAVFTLIQQTIGFAKGENYELAIKDVGIISFLYIWIGMLGMSLVVPPLLLFILPALLCYFYVFLVIGGIVFLAVFFLLRFFPECLSSIRPRQESLDYDMIEKSLNGLDNAAKRHRLYCMGDKEEYTDNQVSDEYERQLGVFKKSGVVHFAWAGYFGSACIFPVFLECAPPLAARFYTGVGYLPSLWITLNERHLATYVTHLRGTLDTKLALINLFT